MASLVISGGESSSGLILPDNYNPVTILADGQAADTQIGSGGSMYVSNGGLADGVTVGVYGMLTVSAGGSAVNIRENGGCVNVIEGAVVDFVANTISGETIGNYIMTVHKNTVANDNTFDWGGRLQVYDGGIASGNITNTNWAGIEVNSGGFVTGTTAYVGSGWMTINSGGSAENTIFNDNWRWGGHMNIMEGAAVTGTTVTAGYMIVKSGGDAKDTLIDNANMNIEGTATNITIQNGTLNVTGGSATGAIVFTSGNVNVTSGGVIDTLEHASGTITIRDENSVIKSLTLHERSTINMIAGATVNGTVDVGFYNTLNISSGCEPVTVLENGGAVNVTEGAEVTFVENTITGATVDNYIMTVHKNTVANENTFGWGGVLKVYDGGTASGNFANANWAGIEVYDGGKVTGTTAFVGSGWMTINSGGSAENTIFDCNWRWGSGLTVLTGASVTGTTVQGDGRMYVNADATANDTLMVRGYVEAAGTVNGFTATGGTLTVTSDGTATNVDLTSATMNVNSGATANALTMTERNTVNVLSGATVNGTVEVGIYNTVNIASGAEPVTIRENGGAVNISEGAEVTFLENTITGATVDNYIMTVHKNTVANENTFGWGGRLQVFDGGVASGNIYNVGWGGIEVNSGGFVTGTTAYVGSGWMTINSGGSAENTLFNDNWYWGGHMNIMEGAAVTGTTITAGYMIVKAGGDAKDTLIDGGNMNVEGTATDITIANGTLNVISGGQAANAEANGGTINVQADGTLTTVTVNKGTTLNVSSGATAATITENGGCVNVIDGAVVDFVANTISGETIGNYIMTVHKNTVANDNTFDWGGRLQVYDGGVASGNIYNVGWGGIEVNSGGFITGTTANMGSGYFNVNSGGSAENTIFSDNWYWGGHMNVRDGASVTGTTITAGYLNVSSGATAADSLVIGGGMNVAGTAETVMVAGGALTVNGGGQATNASLDVGSITVQADGTLTTVTVNKGTTLNVSSGATATAITENGGCVNVIDGAVVDFVANTISGETIGNYIMTVHKNTVANDNTFDWGGRLQVYDGGVASGNVYNVGWGGIDVYSGGKITGTTANMGSGWMNVSSGGSAENTIFSDNWYWGGHMNVLDGASVTGTTITAGYLIVKSGGAAADSLVVGGAMNVDGGGIANGAELTGGSLNVASDGQITGATVHERTTLNISSGATGDAIVEDGGVVNVAEGATVTFAEHTITGHTVDNYTMTVHKNTTAADNLFIGGNLKVYDGYASGNDFEAGWAGIDVYDGGKITGTTANVGSGYLNVHSGGSAENTLFSDNWYWGTHMNVYDGASVTGTTITAGYVLVKSGGLAADSLVVGGEIVVSAGGTANGAELTGGNMTAVGEAALIIGATVNVRTTLNISSGASGNNLVENGGCVNILEGATVTFAEHTITGQTVENYTMTVHKNTVANENTFGWAGILNVYDGGIASGNNFVGNWTGINVYDGGRITGTTANVGSGYLNVYSGGSAENTLFSDNWYWGTHMNVYDGASVTGTTITAGYLIVKNGGTANDTLVVGGEAIISGTVTDLSVTGGGVHIYDGGLLTGQISISDGGNINVNSSGTFLIDISTMAPRTAAKVSGIGRVGGTGTITVKVSDTQANGKYLLSADAAGFNRTISVVDSAGTELGTLTVDGSAVINGTDYHLALSSNTLKLFIGIDVIPSETYVNPEWEGLAENTVVDLAGGGTATIGYDAFATGDAAYAGGDEDDGIVFIQAGTVSFSSKAREVIVSSGAALDVGASVQIAGATVLGGGIATVTEGGTVSTVSAETGGKVLLASGATVSEIIENGGYVEAEEGAAVAFEPNVISSFTASNGCATLHSGTTAAYAAAGESGTILVSSGGIMIVNNVYSGGETVVYGGGEVQSASVYGGGRMELLDGATAGSVYVSNYGELILGGGTISNISATDGARMIVRVTPELEASGTVAGSAFAISGGTATGCRINSAGRMIVSSGAVADGTVVSGGSAEISIQEGAFATSTTVSRYGTLLVHSGEADGVAIFDNAFMYLSGGTATNVAATSGGYITAESGAVIDGLSLNGGYAQAEIMDGATAKNVSAGSETTVVVSSGGHAENVSLAGSGYYNGTLQVFAGGEASGIAVSSGGYLWNTRGATVTDVVIDSDGQAYLHGSGSGVQLNSGGHLGIEAGGEVTGATVGAGGTMYTVNSAGIGTAINTVVQSGASFYNGGRASGTELLTGATMSVVGYNAVAEATTVQSGAMLSAGPNTTLHDVALINGGTVTVGAGGKLSGEIAIEEGASIVMADGTTLDFDLSALSSPGEAPRIADINAIDGTPDLTLTVSAQQSRGTYVLAGGIESFEDPLPVLSGRGAPQGSLTVGDIVRIGDYNYSMALSDTGELSISIVHYFSGNFDGGAGSLIAKETGDTVDIYLGGEILSGWTLDDGWDIAGVGDFNGDKTDDLLRLHASGLVMGDISNGDGTFTPQVLNFKGDGWDILGTGDYDGDGIDDVLVANPTAASETIGLLGYWKSGTAWTLINGYSPEWEMISTGDFNGDGTCDMLWKNRFIGVDGRTYNAFCTWLVGLAPGENDWRMVSVADPSDWNYLAAGDYDGNGTVDVAMINGEGVVGIWDVEDGFLKPNGWSILSAVTADWTLFDVSDYDGDGIDDIAWCNKDSNLVGAWLVKVGDEGRTIEWQPIATLA